MSEPPPVERTPGLSVVIPTYGSSGTLAAVVDCAIETLRPLVDDLEIIIVDDNGTDRCWAELTEIATANPSVRALRLHRNYGQHNATLAGIRNATLPLILTMDDDLQNPPDQVPLLMSELDPATDLVYGYPEEEQQTAGRNIASRTIKRLMSVTLGKEVNPWASSFRLFRSSLVSALDNLADPFLSIDVILAWGTTRIKAVPVRFDERRDGTSNYTTRQLVRHVLNMITGYSTVPLRIVALIGILFSVCGFGLVAFVTTRWALGGAEVPGFTFLAAVVSLFSGMQLLGLGVIGEYLGRMHVRSMGRPLYSIRQIVE